MEASSPIPCLEQSQSEQVCTVEFEPPQGWRHQNLSGLTDNEEEEGIQDFHLQRQPKGGWGCCIHLVWHRNPSGLWREGSGLGWHQQPGREGQVGHTKLHRAPHEAPGVSPRVSWMTSVAGRQEQSGWKGGGMEVWSRMRGLLGSWDAEGVFTWKSEQMLLVPWGSQPAPARTLSVVAHALLAPALTETSSINIPALLLNPLLS